MKIFKQNKNLLVILLVLGFTAFGGGGAKAGGCNLNTTNSSFEYPAISSWESTWRYAMIPDNTATYPLTSLGWQTEPVAGGANDHKIEFRTSGGPDNYPAAHGTGNQYIELNADQPSYVYQDFATTPGFIYTWSFWHCSRSDNSMSLQTCALEAGTPGGSFTNLTHATSPFDIWTNYSGTYIIPPGQFITRFRFVSEYLGDIIRGNFLDDISFSGSATTPGVTTPVKYCKNSAKVSLTATGSQLTWYSTKTSNDPKTIAPEIDPAALASGTYSYWVSQTIGTCESERTEIKVNILDLPTAGISGTTTVNVGALPQNVTLTGSGGTAPYKFTYNIVDELGIPSADIIVNSSGSTALLTVPTNNAKVFTYNLKKVSDSNPQGCSTIYTPSYPNAVVTIKSNIPLPVARIEIDSAKIVENGGKATVTAILDAPSTQTVTVTIALDLSSSNKATSGVDYKAPTSYVFTFTPDPTSGLTPTSQTLLLAEALPDGAYEPTLETIIADISAVSGCTKSTIASETHVETAIIDNFTPTVSLDVVNTTINEGVNQATFSVKLDNPSTKDIIVHLTKSGTTDASDYDPIASLDINIPKGSTTGSTTIIINPINDNIAEPDETVIVTIAPATPTALIGDYKIDLIQNTKQTTILEQLSKVSISIDKNEIAENGGVAKVKATLDQPSTRAVTITIAKTGGTATIGDDYILSSALSFTFDAYDPLIPTHQIDPLTGKPSIENLFVTSEADLILETAPNETIIAAIVTIPIAPQYCTLGTSTVSTSIKDEYTPTVSLEVFNSTINEGVDQATFSVKLDNPSTKDIIVHLTKSGTTDASDYTAITSLDIKVTAGSITGSTTIIINPINDKIAETDETVIMTIAAATPSALIGDYKIDAINKTKQTTILAQIPVVNIAVDKATIAENGGKAIFTISLSEISSSAVIVPLTLTGSATNNGVDFTHSSNFTLTILNGVKSLDFSVTSVKDGIFEPIDETIILDILSTGLTNATRGLNFSDQTAIIDDYTPSVTLTIDSTLIHEIGGKAKVTATLNNPSKKTVTVTLELNGSNTATNIKDFTSDKAFTNNKLTLTFPPNNQEQTVEIASNSDFNWEPTPETIRVDITGKTNCVDGAVTSVTTAIIDNYTPIVTLSINEPSIKELGGEAIVTITLDHPSTRDVNLFLDLTSSTASSDIDFSYGNQAITFPPNTTSQTFTVKALPDAIYEQNPYENIVVKATNLVNCRVDANSVISVSTEIIDDNIPVANDDNYNLGQGSVVDFDILTNDTGMEDGPIAVAITVQPQHGKLTVKNTYEVTYSSDINYKGTDSFMYTITDRDNETDTALVNIDIAGLSAPQGFSPNGDGLNDTFIIPELTEYKQIQITIFNRWGSKVYEEEQYNNNWDGTPNVGILFGQELPSGTYYYVISVKDNGRKICKYVYITR